MAAQIDRYKTSALRRKNIVAGRFYKVAQFSKKSKTLAPIKPKIGPELSSPHPVVRAVIRIARCSSLGSFCLFFIPFHAREQQTEADSRRPASPVGKINSADRQLPNRRVRTGPVNLKPRMKPRMKLVASSTQGGWLANHHLHFSGETAAPGGSLRRSSMVRKRPEGNGQKPKERSKGSGPFYSQNRSFEGIIQVRIHG